MLLALKARLGRQNELFLHTLISFLVRIVAALAGFIVSVVVSRQLGAEEAGYFFLAFSIVMVLAAISRAGLDNTVVRFTGAAMPEDEWHTVKSVLQRAVYVSALLSSIVACAVYFSAEFLALHVFDKPALGNVLRSIAPGIVGLSVFTLLAMSLQGLRRVVASVMTVNIIVNAFLIIGLLVLAVNSAEDAALVYSGATVLTVLVGYMIYSSGLKAGGGDVSWQQIFQSCLPLWVVVIMSQLTQFSGQFIAGAWVSAEEVAQLAVAQRTAMLTSFILMAVNLVVAPRFASMYQKGEFEQLEKLALTSVKLMVLFALPIVVVMMSVPELIMSLFGEGFEGGGVLLQILVIGQFVNVATGSVGYLLTMSGHEKDFRNTVLITGPVAIGLAFLLIPVYGAEGSAIATAIAIALQNLVAVWWVKKRLGFNTLAVWR